MFSVCGTTSEIDFGRPYAGISDHNSSLGGGGFLSTSLSDSRSCNGKDLYKRSAQVQLSLSSLI